MCIRNSDPTDTMFSEPVGPRAEDPIQTPKLAEARSDFDPADATFSGSVGPRAEDPYDRAQWRADRETIRAAQQDGLLLMEDDDQDASINSLDKVTRIRFAMDSGSCRNVTHPKTLPAGVKVAPNATNKHFSGAGGEVIEKFGECTTNIEGEHGRVQCRWNVADVTRPLHSVSQITGPYDGDGQLDVLFNNKRCVVVPPGVLDAVMKQVGAPIAEYHRDGNLYLSDFTMSDFVRQGPNC